MLVPARRQGRAAGRSSVRATLNRGSAREGCPQRNAGSYVGRNRARARPAQTPHAVMLVVRPHFRARDPYRVSGTGPGGAGRAGGQRSDRAGRAARSGLGDGRRAVDHSLGRGCRAPGGRWPTRRAAVVRIIEVPMEDGKGYQAEIYAEGEVRISGQGGPPRPQVRTVLRTRKQVQLRAYRENGLTQWKEPPSDLLILRRSGFVLPEPAATRSKPATSRPEPAAAPSELAGCSAGADPGICHTWICFSGRDGYCRGISPRRSGRNGHRPAAAGSAASRARAAAELDEEGSSAPVGPVRAQRPCGHPGSGNRPGHARRAG